VTEADHQNAEHQNEGPWPRRLAIALVVATFPLIWVGGLVTSTKAGMAVPDWPTTYGYNLFLYPWQTWVFGPWDLFVEHGHRLLGALVGMITIALLVSVWLRRATIGTWLLWTVLFALFLVTFQGVLGGMRVRMNERTLAMIHGCVAPAFFGLVTAIAVFLSPLWRNVTAPKYDATAAKLHRLSIVTLALVYTQLIFGAIIRHVSATASWRAFRLAVIVHLVMAFVLTLHVALLWWHVRRHHRGETALRRPAAVLTTLMGLQLALGAATWIVKFGWPTWVGEHSWNAGFIVQANGWLQAGVVTSHVAVGSLIFAMTVVLALRGLRLVRSTSTNQQLAATSKMGLVT